jgi:hypothetical protein
VRAIILGSLYLVEKQYACLAGTRNTRRELVMKKVNIKSMVYSALSCIRAENTRLWPSSSVVELYVARNRLVRLWLFIGNVTCVGQIFSL